MKFTKFVLFNEGLESKPESEDTDISRASLINLILHHLQLIHFDVHLLTFWVFSMLNGSIYSIDKIVDIFTKCFAAFLFALF